MPNTVNFYQTRLQLLVFLPDECVTEIEKYYYSLFYADILYDKKITNCSIKVLSPYYSTPVIYVSSCIVNMSQSKSKLDKKNILTHIIRYLIYNRTDFFLKHWRNPVSKISYKRLMESVEICLKNNNKDMENIKYYYEQLFFKVPDF